MSGTSPDSRKSELQRDLESIRSQIPSTPDRNVTLVAVSKLKPASDIQLVYDLGHRNFGENYIQELIEKSTSLPSDITWHFIGGLQSNKCKSLASSVGNLVVETVDSVKKANELNKGRKARDSLDKEGRLKVFVQVNTSGEKEKSGVSEDAVEGLAQHVVRECACLELTGLMTIGALATSRQEGENQDFKKLREVRDKLEKSLGITLKLSMGMSQDFAEAVALGSDEVRVGSKIFGARPPKKSEQVEEKTAEEKE